MENSAKGQEVSTLADVIKSHEKLIALRHRLSSILVIDCGQPDAGRLIENVGSIFSERARTERKAIKLFQGIGKQVCADNDIPWGSKVSNDLPRDEQLSAAAQDKLREFLSFVEENL